jgi:hypothetical protein
MTFEGFEAEGQSLPPIFELGQKPTWWLGSGRLFNSTLMIVDQAAINARSDFRMQPQSAKAGPPAL